MKLTDIKINPKNPRIIKDDRFKELVKSIEQFPKMMKLRPIVIDSMNMILGGNMRFKALQELKYKEVPDEWIKRADELTEDEKRRFIIADNVGFGDHDWDVLANEWDIEELGEWGLDIEIPEEIQSKKETKEIIPFKKTHILLSFPPNKIIEIQEIIDKLLLFDFIEYEQASN